MAPVESGAPGLKRRHVVAVTLGNALEFYDFVTYAFFAIPIGHAFFPSSSAYGSLMLSLATFGAGFVTRPIGGVVIGAYADRVGRKPAMLLCFSLIGASIAVLAFTPSYATIGIAAPIVAVLARMVQGFSLGGEVGPVTAYVIEAAASGKRGLVAAWLGASQSCAALCGSLLGLVLAAILPADVLDAYGWRIAFLLGASVLPFGLWLRSSLPETHEAPERAGASIPASHAPAGPSRLAVARQHWRPLLTGLVVLGGGTIVTYVRSYVATYAQGTLHLSAHVAFLAQSGAMLATIPTMLVGGHLSDRFGRRPVTLGCSAVALLLVYPIFVWVATSRSGLALVAGMTILGGATSAAGGAYFAALGESVPAAIRSSGFGTVYSTSVAIFGGTTQLVVTWLIHATGNPLAPSWYMLAAMAVVLAALATLPESAPVRMRWNPQRGRAVEGTAL